MSYFLLLFYFAFVSISLLFFSVLTDIRSYLKLLIKYIYEDEEEK